MNTITNRSLIKTCRTLLRLQAGSRLVRRSPVVVSSLRDKSDASEEQHPPIKFSQSEAIHKKPIGTLVSPVSGMNRPNIEVISLYVSFFILIIYAYCREENDWDEQFNKTLDEALELQGFNTEDLKKKRERFQNNPK